MTHIKTITIKDEYMNFVKSINNFSKWVNDKIKEEIIVVGNGETDDNRLYKR